MTSKTNREQALELEVETLRAQLAEAEATLGAIDLRALRESEAHYRLLADNISDVIWVLDLETGRFRYVSPSIKRLRGYTVAEALAEKMEDALTPAAWTYLSTVLPGRLAEFQSGQVQPYTDELEQLCKDGTTVWVEVTSRFVINPDNGHLEVYGASRDITARRRVEERVHRLSRLYATLSQVNQTIVRVKERDRLFQATCQVAVEFGQFRLAWVGLVEAETGRMTPAAYHLADPGDAADHPDRLFSSEPLRLALQTGQIVTYDDIRTTSDLPAWREAALQNGYQSAAIVPLHCQGAVAGVLSLYAAAAGHFTEEERSLLVEMGLDISFALDGMIVETRRQRAETELRTSEQKLRTLFELLPVGISILDQEQHIVAHNPALSKILGLSPQELISGSYQRRHYLRPDGTSLPPAEFPTVLAVTERREVTNVEIGVVKEDGTITWTNVSATPVGMDDWQVIMAVSDITEQRQVEVQLQQQAARLQVLADASRAFTEVGPDYQAVLKLVARLMAKQVDAGCVLRLISDDGQSLEPVMIYDTDPAAQPAIRAFFESTAIPMDDPNPLAQVVRTGQPHLVPVVDLDQMRAALPASLRPAFDHFRPHSTIMIPLQVQRQPIGLLTFTRSRPGQPSFTMDDLYLAQDLADRAALAIGSARLFGQVQAELAERQRTETAIRASEARYLHTLEAMLEGCQIIGFDWRYLYLNDVAEKHNRRPKEELLGRKYTEMWPGIEATDVFKVIQRCMNERLSQSLENEFIFPDGSPGWFELRIYPVPEGVVILSINITARKRAEEKLRTSGRMLKLFVEYAPAAIAMFDGEMNYMAASRRYLADYRLATQDIVGRSHYEIFPEIPERLKEIHRRCLAGATEKAEEDPFPRLDGTLDWVRWEIHPWYEESGVIGGLLLFSEVITGRKQAEAALRESETRFRTIFEQAAVGIVQVELETGRFVRMNEKFCQIVGYSPEELQTKTFHDLTYPDDLPADLHQMARLLAGEIPTFSLEKRYIHKNDSIVWVNLTVSLVGTVNQKPRLNIAIVEDITVRKQVEAALRESLAKYRVLFESFPLGVTISDKAGRIVETNRESERLLGLTTAEHQARVVDSSQWQIIRPDGSLMPPEEYASVRALLESRLIEHVEMGIIKDQGQVTWIDVTAAPIPLEEYGVAITYSDITARKEAEAELRAERASLARRVEERTTELRQANVELARAMRAKDEFLANMSHELRTPLNAILGLSESLQEQVYGSLNERQLRSISTIEGSGRHLLGLINDILDLSKVEAGKLELNLESVWVAEVCQASLLFIKEMAQKKNLRLAFHPDPQPVKLLADPRRLKQILVNLLTNAVKFTPAGGEVSLEVTTDPLEEMIRLAVQDTGIGIKAEEMAKLFRPFSQIDSSLARQHEGTGLGLTLVRRLVELHGGSVSLESAGIEGLGSRFTVSLPWQPRAEEPFVPVSSGHKGGSLETGAALPAAGGERTGTVLLAEDNKMNITTISDYLIRLGYTVMVARNGREALERADETQPDIILMDIQMPGLDGLQATRHLRADPRFAATPIIALTALAMPGDRERCLAAGATDYMTKPVSLKGLAQRIEALLNR